MILNFLKKDSSKIITFILCIALLVTFTPITSLADDDDPLDVTKYVNFDSFDLFLKDSDTKIVDKGKLVDDASVKVGDDVYLKYYWSISNKNMKYITSGAFFTIDLPGDVFDFDGISEAASYGVMCDNIQIGTLTIIKNGDDVTLKVVFNEAAVDANELKNGWLRADGNVNEVDEGTTSIAIDDLIIPIDIDPDPDPGGSTTYKDGSNWKWWHGDHNGFNKKSTFDPKTGTASYTLYVDDDQYESVFEGGSAEQHKNVLIEDELQEGVKYIYDSLVIDCIYYLAMGENTPSSQAIDPIEMSSSDFGRSNFTSQFEEFIPDDPFMEYEEFKNQIKSKTVPTYGIWQNKKIVINMGDIPGDIEYQHTWSEIKTMIDNKSKIVTWTTYDKASDGSISLDDEGNPTGVTTTTSEAFSQSVKQASKEAWAHIYGIPIDDMDNEIYDDVKGKAVGFRIKFDTHVTGSDRKVTNEAVMYYGDDETSSNINEYAFYSMSGGVERGQPGDVELIKYDGDTYEELPNVEFKIQIYNDETEQYEDIASGKKGAGTYTTDEDGSILISELPYGEYRFVETEWLDGYEEETSFIDGDGTFEINGDLTELIQITALNWVEDEDDDDDEDETITPIDIDDNVVTPGNLVNDNPQPSVHGIEAKTYDSMTSIQALLIMGGAAVLILLSGLWRILRKKE